jgi:hypothetical protein
MMGTRKLLTWATIPLFGGACLVTMSLPMWAQETQPGATAPAGSRKVGTVKSITGNTLVIKPDAGADTSVTVADSTRIVRLAPGQTDLKSATPMALNEVQVGDRMLVRGAPGSAPDSIVAASIVVMKAGDVSQKQQQQLQDWQRRGAGGIVTAVDAASGSITIASTPTVSYVVKTSPSTGFLRYAPNSIKFSDAVKGTFDQINTGDQLRARGNRSADGKEVAAEEVISGTFRNIAGTVTAIDAANSALTVKDILGKKTVVVKVTPESQMRKLPAQLAQRIAFVLKGPATGQGGAATPASASGTTPGSGTGAAGSQTTGAGGPGGGPGQRPGGAPDFQQMISRLPAVTLADLQKDDAVMIVSTPGTGGSEVTAITLLGGVEPILTASPNGMGAAALLSGWNLSAPGGGEGPQ